MRDFFQQPFTEAELRGLLHGRPASDAFSWRSPSVKALGLGGKRLSDAELVQWMLREPRLIKRPILVLKETVFFGFRPAELEAYL